MDLIEQSSDLQDALGSLKRPNAVQYANGQFTPAELEKYLKSGRLSMYVGDSLVFLLLNQEYFYRAYCFLALPRDTDRAAEGGKAAKNSETVQDGESAGTLGVPDGTQDEALLDPSELQALARELGGIDMPIVMEFSYMRERSQKMKRVLPLWSGLGFLPFHRIVRYQLDLVTVAPPLSAEVKLPEGCSLQRNAIGSAKAHELWMQQLEPFQSLNLDPAELETLAQAGAVSAVWDDETLCAALLTRTRGQSITLGPVATAPSHRGRGLASALYCESLRFHQEQGARRAVAWIEEHNKASIALHESLGFQPDGTVIESFLHK